MAQSPAVSVEEISDPALAGSGIDWVELDAVKLQSKPLLARRVTVRLSEATVLFHSVNQRVRTRTTVKAGHLAFAAFGPQAHGTLNGLPVRPGMLLAAAPGAEANFVVGAGWESVTFLLPQQDIQAHLTARRRRPGFHRPQGLEVLHRNPQRVLALFHWGKLLADTAARQPELFNDLEPERCAAQVELVEILLDALGGTSDFQPARSDRTRQARSLLVRKVEDHVLSHVGEALSVTDLCRAAAVSERSLEYAFNEVLGLTPMAYLRRLRLHRARQALLAARPGSTTVSAEALNWGFWHLGEFSRDYKGCFGESPSETLREGRMRVAAT